MDERDLPFRTGVRAAQEGAAVPLPAFLIVRFDELIQRKKQHWEAYGKTPRWWLEHLEQHVITCQPHLVENKAGLQPEAWPFFVSSLWWLAVLGVWSHIVTTSTGPFPRMFYALYPGVPLALTVVTIISAHHEGSRDFRANSDNGPTVAVHCVKWLLIPPVSLWLGAKEFVAWIFWRLNGRRWTFLSWSVQRAIEEEVWIFKWDSIRALSLAVVGMRNRISLIGDERLAMQVRLDALRARVKELEAQPNAAEQAKEEAGRVQVRVETLAAQAEQLRELADEAENRIKALEGQTKIYQAFQESRENLRAGRALLPNDNTDLEQRTFVRDAYVAAAQAVQRMEAPFDPARGEDAADERSDDRVRVGVQTTSTGSP